MTPAKQSSSSSKKLPRKENHDIKISGWNINEKDLESKLADYYSNVEDYLKLSFAPIPLLIESMASGYDPHFMVLKNETSG